MGIAIGAGIKKRKAVRRWLGRAFFPENATTGGDPASLACCKKSGTAKIEAIGWVKKDGRCRWTWVWSDLADVPDQHAAAVLGTQALHICGDQPGGRATSIDEYRMGGPARQGLKPERARSGKKIKHMNAVETYAVVPVFDHVKQAFTNPIGGGAKLITGRDFPGRCQRPSAPSAPDDPHDFKSALRSLAGSETASDGGDFPISISFFPTM